MTYLQKLKIKIPTEVLTLQELIIHFGLVYQIETLMANSVEPDEMPQNVASHLELHCLLSFKATFINRNYL